MLPAQPRDPQRIAEAIVVAARDAGLRYAELAPAMVDLGRVRMNDVGGVVGAESEIRRLVRAFPGADDPPRRRRGPVDALAVLREVMAIEARHRIARYYSR